MNGRDDEAGDVVYVARAGTAYHVQGPLNPEPVWRRCDEFSEDAERAKDQAKFKEYEPSCRAFGIDA
jgi:hypothetical protein